MFPKSTVIYLHLWWSCFLWNLTFPSEIVSLKLQISNLFIPFIFNTHTSLAQKWYCHLSWRSQWATRSRTWGSISLISDSTPDEPRWCSWSWWWQSENLKSNFTQKLHSAESRQSCRQQVQDFKPNQTFKVQTHQRIIIVFFLAVVLAFLIHQISKWAFHLSIFAILVVDIFWLTAVLKCLVSQDTLLSSFGKIHCGSWNLKAFGHNRAVWCPHSGVGFLWHNDIQYYGKKYY